MLLIKMCVSMCMMVCMIDNKNLYMRPLSGAYVAFVYLLNIKPPCT